MAVKSAIHIRGFYLSTWDKTEIERIHFLQFHKRLPGVLNISTGNIMGRAELVRYPFEAEIETVNFIKHEREIQKRLWFVLVS